jgi:DNA-binding MarR family transcriptional regulator
VPSDPLFDSAIHAPNRLRLCAALRVVDRMEFRALREVLDLSDASLSKTIGALADAGYVRTTKAASRVRDDARRTTSVALTATGRRAFDGHMAALRELAGDSWEGHTGGSPA